MDELQDKFHTVANYAVIVLTLILSTSIGVYFWWRGHKNHDDYVLGGRSMSALPVALSLATSFTSASTMIGVPTIIFGLGTPFSFALLTQIVQIWVVSKFYMPLFMNLRLTTVYQYLMLRFYSKVLRYCVVAYFVIVMTVYLSVVAYTPSLALSVVAGLELYSTSSVIWVVCGLYTCMGGLKAVLWTDALQFFIMVGSFLALAIGGTVVLFGQDLSIFDIPQAKFPTFDPDLRKSFSFWSLLIGFNFLGVHTYGVCQTQVQRYLSCKSAAVAKQALWLNFIAAICLQGLCVYVGLLMKVYYSNGIGKLPVGTDIKKDEYVPWFMLQVLGNMPGLPGLFISGLLCGTLSTVSSGMNAFATICVQDGLYSFGYLTTNDNSTARRRLLVTRLVALIFCIIGFALTFVVAKFEYVLEASFDIVGLLAGPVLGLFTLGMFVPFASRCGALVGFFTGVSLASWIFIGRLVVLANGEYGCWTKEVTVICSPWHLALYDLGLFWSPTFIAVWVFVIGIIASLFKPQDPTMLAASLISPGATSLFSWWPLCARKSLDSYFASIGTGLEEENFGEHGMGLKDSKSDL